VTASKFTARANRPAIRLIRPADKGTGRSVADWRQVRAKSPLALSPGTGTDGSASPGETMPVLGFSVSPNSSISRFRRQFVIYLPLARCCRNTCSDSKIRFVSRFMAMYPISPPRAPLMPLVTRSQTPPALVPTSTWNL